MSDFLSRLADRALGHDAPVSPRLHSLFEPERPVPGTGLGWAQASPDWAEGTPADGRPAAGTVAGREPGLGRGGADLGWPGSPAPEAGQTVTARQAGGPRDGRARGSALAAAPSASALAAPIVAAVESEDHLPSHPDVPDVPDAPSAGERADIGPGPRGTRAGRPPREPSWARVTAAHPGQLPVGGTEPPPLGRRVFREDAWPVSAEPGVSPTGVPSPGSGIAARTYEVLSARVLQPHDRNRALQIPGPEPVVTITIGRVDVRAEPASESDHRATPAPRRGPEPLSLNEYLRRREQGG